MSSIARGKSFQLSLDTSSLPKYHHNYLLLYTAFTLFVVLLVYVITKDWKGYTSPEEVDLGTVRVHVPTCRRKHSHLRTQSHSHY